MQLHKTIKLYKLNILHIKCIQNCKLRQHKYKNSLHCASYLKKVFEEQTSLPEEWKDKPFPVIFGPGTLLTKRFATLAS